MVPLSFEGTPRPSSVEPLNLIPPPAERPRSDADESFESHLHYDEESVTPPPARHEQEPSRELDRRPEDDQASATSPASSEEHAGTEEQPAAEEANSEETGSEQAVEVVEDPAATATAEAVLEAVAQESADVSQDGETLAKSPGLSNEADVAKSPALSQQEAPLDEDLPDEGDEPETDEAESSRRSRSAQRPAEKSEAELAKTSEAASSRDAKLNVADGSNAAGRTSGDQSALTSAVADPQPKKKAPSENRQQNLLTAMAKPAELPTETSAAESASTSSDSDRRGQGERQAGRVVQVPTADESASTSSIPSQRFAQHLRVASGERPAEGPQLNGADHGRFIERVARAFRVAEGRDGIVRIRLSPPELGSLRLELKVQGGALAARLEAETPAARSLLIDNVSVLRERLAEQGIRVEQFDVELLDRQTGGPFDGLENREQGQENDQDSSSAASQQTGEENELSEGDSRENIFGENDQLDVVI